MGDAKVQDSVNFSKERVELTPVGTMLPIEFEPLISQECSIDEARFWKALNIWLKSPHVVNRQILASSFIFVVKLPSNEVEKIYNWINNLQECILSPYEKVKDDLLNSLKQEDIESNVIDTCYFEDDLNYAELKENEVCLRVAQLLPRDTEKFSSALEFAIVEKQNVTYCYKHAYGSTKLLGFGYPYRIIYDKHCISIDRASGYMFISSEKWLKECLFPRLLGWMKNDLPKSSLIAGSLHCICLHKYTNLYNDLKKKYGTEIVKIWPETTDPLKFVYEDVAIAAYLLTLWEAERAKNGTTKRQSFLDLGCGNGLLVHILSSEGHPGLGIDLRRRKIWDMYPETTRLEVRTIIPSSKSLFPDTDWLIGNHSDELTPWIPVIAARSSYNCRFFLLPCCAFEFNGNKYQRQTTSASQYSQYMHYVQDISNKCGFKTEIDKLRIPSTKRICIIGTERTYSNDESEAQDSMIQKMINDRCGNNINNDQQWSADFKPRDVIEKVRNCTQINKDLISHIISIVVDLLLRKVRMITVKCNPDIMWNAGGEIELREVVDAIPIEQLKELKNECGGIQTLLRNNAHIFKVEKGKVRFRIPGQDIIGKGKNKKRKNQVKATKIKSCWFHENHPNGCLLTNDECQFKH